MTAIRRSLEDEYDFVAIGAGTGGLVGAMTAADLGLRTLIVEKTELLGGVTAYSQGQMWVPGSYPEREAGIADSAEDGLGYLIRLGMGFTDRDLAMAYVALAPHVLRYLSERHRVRWRLVDDLADYYYPDFPEARATGRYLEVEPFPGGELGALRPLLRVARHLPYRLSHQDLSRLGCSARSHEWDRGIEQLAIDRDDLCLGTGLAAYLVRAAAEAGVQLITEGRVTGIETKEGRVTGLSIDYQGEATQIRVTRGVLLATGGYDWRPELTASFEGQLDITSAAPPSVTGDHLSLAIRLGAATAHYPKALRLGVSVPGQVDDGHPLHQLLGAMALPHAILVNRHGRRFGDESFYASIGHALREIDGRSQQFRNWPCWIVFDEQFRRTYKIGSISPNTPFPDDWTIHSAPTIERLAHLAGIDAVGLREEIEKFNCYSESGKDADFGRGERPWARKAYGDSTRPGNPNLGPIAEGPFYALRPILIGVGIPSLGLRTDRHGRVLDDRGAVINGLYAAGNSAALAEVGAGYQSGVANVRGAVFAFTAAHDAAGQPVDDKSFRLAD